MIGKIYPPGQAMKMSPEDHQFWKLRGCAPALLKACELALLEFDRISYQIKADSEVIACIQKVVKKAKGEG